MGAAAAMVGMAALQAMQSREAAKAANRPRTINTTNQNLPFGGVQGSNLLKGLLDYGTMLYMSPGASSNPYMNEAFNALRSSALPGAAPLDYQPPQFPGNIADLLFNNYPGLLRSVNPDPLQSYNPGQAPNLPGGFGGRAV